ncbi:SRPBCC family protein [uncultured Tateyamaria sp.]|uniref:SRPBCC family protein n=1 Tax=uncultured Tateyamaria sp. TaxID=455651 RepID=UPI00262F7054|nr:SRPBCC family protein [uncultured Tateyamaria sp.]
MKTVTVKEIVEAPVDQVWASWDDFGAVARFHPGIKASRLMDGSAQSGIGASRQCDLSANGKQFVREKIVSYDPPHRMVIDIFEATVPIRSAQATLTLTPRVGNMTLVTMTMQFTPGMGLIGRLMSPMMASQFRSMLGKVLKSNADYVTKGTEIAH